jgi:hypothetical protein
MQLPWELKYKIYRPLIECYKKEERVQNLNLQMPKTPQIVKINTNIKLDSTLIIDVDNLWRNIKTCLHGVIKISKGL